MFRKESIRIESSTQHSSVNDFVVINILEEDVEHKQIILDPDDQPMWESAKTVAPTPSSAIIQLDVDDNFVVNTTHLNMIQKNKFDGYLRADPHDHIREFLAICDMFKYGETKKHASKMSRVRSYKGVIIQIFYHGLDEPIQGILDVTLRGIFLYKSPNQAFQLLEDKVLFNHDWSTKSKTEHHQESISFADGSDSNTDNSRFIKKLKVMDS
nr:reverse transcriptase domain-containing protein [Tanacetum cinerariifolium]